MKNKVGVIRKNLLGNGVMSIEPDMSKFSEIEKIRFQELKELYDQKSRRL